MIITAQRTKSIKLQIHFCRESYVDERLNLLYLPRIAQLCLDSLFVIVEACLDSCLFYLSWSQHQNVTSKWVISVVHVRFSTFNVTFLLNNNRDDVNVTPSHILSSAYDSYWTYCYILVSVLQLTYVLKWTAFDYVNNKTVLLIFICSIFIKLNSVMVVTKSLLDEPVC